jgi:hypothetical protein
MPQELPRIGGSFAPPLTDELIARDKALIDGLNPSPIKDAMTALLACCEHWWQLPESDSSGQKHESGTGLKVALRPDHAAELDPLIPWQHEIESYKVLFDSIDPVSNYDLRNAAHHLLWHVCELDLGREPMTSDKL